MTFQFFSDRLRLNLRPYKNVVCVFYPFLCIVNLETIILSSSGERPAAPAPPWSDGGQCGQT
jgi:hypothetical protein